MSRTTVSEGCFALTTSAENSALPLKIGLIMSLIKCKECGNPVSSKAEQCPKCGFVISKKGAGCIVGFFKLIGGLIGAAIGLIVATAYMRETLQK